MQQTGLRLAESTAGGQGAISCFAHCHNIKGNKISVLQSPDWQAWIFNYTVNHLAI